MTPPEQAARDIRLYVQRYDPEREGSRRWWQEYPLHVTAGMTVLEGLHAVKEEQDATICYRFSCRMGVCGSCGMLINGKLALACNTQILHVADRTLALAPMPNFDVVRDLVPDLGPLFEKHQSVEPYLQRPDLDELENPTGEFLQTKEQLDEYLQFSCCIRCGLCVASCPTVATDERYIGPMALAQAERYNTDRRDGGFHSRKHVVGATGGAFSCHYAGECSNVCPKGVDPARAIQRLKRDLVFDYLRLRRGREPSPVLGTPKDAQRRPEIPEAPPHSVESAP
jgi:succinate dehydrogenase / fumarate reductase iron-sulfur subunit